MTDFLSEISCVDTIMDVLVTFCQMHPYYLSSEFSASGCTLREKLLHRHRYAKDLSKRLKQETFHFGSASIHEIKTQPGKVRLIHRFSIEDQLVMKLIAKACMPRLIQIISPTVFSYLPGRSHLQAIQYLCHYLRKNRDIYLLRTDMTHYTDSIYVNPSAPLWSILEDFLQKTEEQQTVSPYVMQLFHQALRPIIQEESGADYQQCRGIALGTSLTPIIANLYLSSLDKLMLSQGVELYMRFGDDIIIADMKKERLLQCDALFSEQIEALHLIRQGKKDKYYWINRAGRSAVYVEKFKGSICFDYLGSKLMANGTIALPVAKQSKVLSDIFHRIDRLHHQLEKAPIDIQGPVLCQSLSNSFVTSALSCRYQELLVKLVNHEPQLKQIDYLIARYIAQKLSGEPGVRAFRKIPYQQLREWGLVSLCYLRNHSHLDRVSHG